MANQLLYKQIKPGDSIKFLDSVENQKEIEGTVISINRKRILIVEWDDGDITSIPETSSYILCINNEPVEQIEKRVKENKNK